MTYDEFLKTKEIRAEACGFDIDRDSIKNAETEMDQSSLFDEGNE